MKKHSSRKVRSSEVNLGFQIAPMIDVVFVILLYFMVMAGDARVERFNYVQLPGRPPEPGIIDGFQDVVVIRIEDDGQVLLNDDLLDSPESRSLPELAGNLEQLKQSNLATSKPLMVTIDASELGKYQRVMDVLDTLSLANITNITFQANDF
jgi:biopolymer transport protein ExbD